jgi:hypothetical protein
MGPNFKVDAVIYNPEIYKRARGAIHLAAAQTAVVMEFKEETTADSDEEYEVSYDCCQIFVSDNLFQNQNQLAAVANRVMNDDPRRKWMYGVRPNTLPLCVASLLTALKITIEKTNMSLWYFSRSYSIKSAPFCFTKVGFSSLVHSVRLNFSYRT